MIFYVRNFGQHPNRNAAADRTDYRVEVHIFEMLAVRLAAYPVVAEEHHCLFAVTMAYIHEFAYRLAYESFDEFHIFFKFFGRIAETVVIVAAINEIFRNEFYSALFFKVRDQNGVGSLRVTEPFHLLFLT